MTECLLLFYSSDLVPCNFWLFNQIEMTVKWKCFEFSCKVKAVMRAQLKTRQRSSELLQKEKNGRICVPKKTENVCLRTKGNMSLGLVFFFLISALFTFSDHTSCHSISTSDTLQTTSSWRNLFVLFHPILSDVLHWQLETGHTARILSWSIGRRLPNVFACTWGMCAHVLVQMSPLSFTLSYKCAYHNHFYNECFLKLTLPRLVFLPPSCTDPALYLQPFSTLVV